MTRWQRESQDPREPPRDPRFVKLVRKCRNFDRFAAVAAFHAADESQLGFTRVGKGMVRGSLVDT